MSNLIEQKEDWIDKFDRAMQVAGKLANSALVPKDFRGKPEDIVIAIQWGEEVGLKPMQSLQSMAVINGRPSVWGDAMLAIVLAHPDCLDVSESDDGEEATCVVKRKGHETHIVTFSNKDAQVAGLLGKPGPWTQYPKRMRQMRARGFALRDKFSDALKGMMIAEEAMDMPRDASKQDVITGLIGSLEAPTINLTKMSEPEHQIELPKITAESILKSISESKNIEELDLSVQDAPSLNDSDKKIVRASYRAKKSSFGDDEVQN